MERIKVNIERIVMQGVDLPPDRARLLKEQVRSELQQMLKKTGPATVLGRNTTRAMSQPATIQLPDGRDGQRELAGKLAREILSALNVPEGHGNDE
ncbi:MAG: hypothetical protein V5A84_02740 [Planctomycetota bacterium]